MDKGYNGCKLRAFNLTAEEYGEYRSNTFNLLLELYKDNIIYEDNVPFIGLLPFETGRKASIMDLAQNNIASMNYIVEAYTVKDYAELMHVVNNNYRELFHPDGEHFQKIYNIIRQTDKMGAINEEIAITYCDEVLSRNLNKEIKTKPAETKKQDMKKGIDLIFKDQYNNIRTIQVKPLGKYIVKNGKFHIQSKGYIKKYKTSMLCFVNSKTKKCFLFKNKDVEYSNNEVIIKFEHLVK